MRGTYLILDFGTTALKTVLFDESFNIVAKRSMEFHYLYPQNTHIEFNATNYLNMALQMMKELVVETNSQHSIRAISISSQAETLVPVDAQGKPLSNAIVWLDTRAAEESRFLSHSIHCESFYQTTGMLEVDPIMPVAKLMWIKKNNPSLYMQTSKFLLLRDYVFYWLTGEMVSEYSVASCSGFFDIEKKVWSMPILDVADIDAQKLPKLTPSNYRVTLQKEIAKNIGIGEHVQVVNGMLDQSASAIGSGNIHQGIISETTGTVLAVAATISQFEPKHIKNKVPVLCHGLNNRYLALPNCPTAGILLKWFKDNFLDQQQFASSEQAYEYINHNIKQKKQFNENLIILPHFCGRTSPVPNPNACGVMYGLNLGTDKFDIARAIMESVGYLLKENLALLAKNGIQSEQIVSLGGGARSPMWLQMKADITGKEVAALCNEESSSLGAALGAALAMGHLKDEKSIASYIKPSARYLPSTKQTELYEHKYNTYLQVNTQLGFL